MTNSLWVTQPYFFARQSHESCLIQWPTAGEWHWFISCQAVSWITSHPMTNSESVTPVQSFAMHSHQSYLIPLPIGSEWCCFIFVRHFHQSCLIHWPWPTGCKLHSFISCQINHVSSWQTACEWQCFISLPGSLINNISSHNQQIVSEQHYSHQWHVLSHDQKDVSDTALLSSVMSYPTTTNREWATLLYFFARQSHQSCLISLWPIGSKSHYFISLQSHLINHVSSHNQQLVSHTVHFARHSSSLLPCLISWPTGCEWQCCISLAGNLISNVSSMTNRKWVTLLYSFTRHSHQSFLIHSQFVSETPLFHARQFHQSCHLTTYS